MDGKTADARAKNRKKSRRRKTHLRREPMSAGIIMSALMSLYLLLRRIMSKSLLAGIFCSYDRAQELLSKSGFMHSRIIAAVGKRLRKIRISAARLLGANPLRRAETSVAMRMLRHATANYGWFLFCVGAYSCVMQPIKWYIGGDGFDISALIVPGIMILLSLPFLLDRRSLASTVCSSTALSFIAFNLLGAREYKLHPEENALSSPGVVIALGMALGLVSYFIDPLYILIGAGVLLCGICILHTPQVGVVLTILAVPFLPIEYTLAAVLLTDASYIIKLICGKRGFSFTVIDIFVVTFSVLVLAGGFISADRDVTPVTSLIAVAVISVYFLAKNLIVSYEWIKRCYMACITSSLMAASLCLYRTFSGLFDTGDYFHPGEGAVQLVKNSSASTLCLMLLCPFALIMMLQKQRLSAKIPLFITFILSSVALVFSDVPVVTVSFALAFLIIMLVYSEKTFSALAVVVPFAVILFQLLPDRIRGELSSGPYTDGAGASLYSQLADKLGGVCVAVLAAVMLCFFSMVATRIGRGRGVPELRSQYLLFAPAFSALSLLAAGFGMFVWDDGRVMLLFFMMIGLGSAVYTFSKNGEELARIKEDKIKTVSRGGDGL